MISPWDDVLIEFYNEKEKCQKECFLCKN